MSNERSDGRIAGTTRREFVRKAGVASALAVGGLPMWARPAGAYSQLTQKPLRIGFFTALSGPLAASGIDLQEGFKLYLKSRRGKLNGRPVDVSYQDDGGNPAQSLNIVQRYNEQDKKHIVVGGINAASGPPVFDYVNSVGMPWINPLIATDELTQKKPNSYMIRVGGTGSQNAHYFAEWIRKHHKEIKNVAVCSWDYLFGYQTTGGFQDVFQRLGGAVVQKIWMPLGTADPAPFISRIDTSVDAVYSVFGSVDAIRYLSAYRQFGLKGKLPLLGNFTLTDETVLAGLPADAATGVLTDGRYSAILRNPQSRALQRLFNASNSDPCSNNVCDGWVSAQAVEAGLKATHNQTQNRRKFAAAFRGITVNTPRGPMKIDDRLNPVQNVYIRRVDPAGPNLPPGYRLPVQNTVLATIKNGTQFWKFQPAGYIARPSYSRDYPPAKGK